MENPTIKFNESETLFLSLVSIEIKSLINAITEVSRSLSAKLDNSGKPDDSYINECVQLIHSASKNVKPLIDDLVAIGELQASYSPIKPLAIYNLRHELECACDTFAYELLSKQIDMSLFFAADIPVIFCDLESLRILVFNKIMSNAIRHTPVGGKISIVVELSDDNTMVIKISDSGPGIPAPERESVFRRYRKSGKYRKTSGGNRGIGLYNALLCVQAHKGKLSIVSEPGISGATFKIEIPLYSGCIQ